ncbi:MAG: pyruvate:ferredoxin (flavodoxin) oxidoreductase [Paludibacteraceae bacterium]|nr:pyruvate:ferredoxin (flavodoxin) oxidoreductase [Paludibacteraceae bacterium]
MSKEKKFMTCDGNAAAAHIAYMFTEVAAIYPITPSSPMAENVDEWAAVGRKNMFGETVLVQEMQSEAGAAGAVHGSLAAGALTTTFTASQGLLLMIPNMYKIAGELIPTVFHVSARTLASHVLCIFGDHQDVMACRQTGFAMLAEGSVQEVMDLAGVAHLSTIKSRVPFLNFFDGFRTSHEYQKVEVVDMEDLRPLVDMKALEEFRQRALSPMRPVMRGMAENPDVFFAHRESSNTYYNNVADIVSDYMDKISEITGRKYRPFTYYGAADAENIIICMGSACEAIREVIDYEAANGKKLGMINVHLYRPFSLKYLKEALPASVKRICVLDRTKEPGANGEPLYLDVKDALQELGLTDILVVGGRYGLGSNDTTPAQMLAVYENLALPMPKNHFTVGINDDVTFTSLPVGEEIAMGGKGMFQAKFYGLGADGTVGANKNSVKIIGEGTDKYCQAYFSYDSKKSGGFTCSHLRFGDEPIHSTYLVTTPNFVACHVQAYLQMYDVTRGLQKNGTFLLNTIWNADELKHNLPNKVKKYFADNNIKVYYINATKIAQEIGLGNRTNTILQSAFFRITEVIPVAKAVEDMKHFIDKSYGKKGEDVVKKNYAAVDRGGEYQLLDIDPAWSNLGADEAKDYGNEPEFITNVVRPINGQDGDLLPVSSFKGIEDGTWPAGTAKYEKRGVSAFVPVWNADNCIECNKCAYVCPHACIRPFVLDEDEVKGFAATTREMKAPAALKGMHFRMQVGVLDCLGCGNCVDVCPGNPKLGKALQMVDLESQMAEAANWDYCVEQVKTKQHLIDIQSNVKNSQFATPLFEFSGACSGCGETPYLKLISQLFGDREIAANATGCTSIYSGSVPSTPYTTNEKGHGPAWSNSLFEDFCEYGLGMQIAHRKIKERLARLMRQGLECDKCSDELKAMFTEWLENMNNAEVTKRLYEPMVAAMSACGCDTCKQILTYKDHIVKRSQWIIGGDGASYDIGYGGLDHVIASGEDVNILVLDTEVYSNTGGQASKSTPLGAIAKFAAAGKRVRKKDLGMIATTYGYVYVAQIAMGADQAQTLKAIREAEAYPGPSLIIAYAPCINHGLKAGMGKSQAEEEKAVECGYWHLWRYNPALEKEGKNPFTLDSKEPNWDNFEEYLKGEVRFASVMKQYPSEAAELYAAAKENAQWRYRSYQRMLQTNWEK